MLSCVLLVLLILLYNFLSQLLNFNSLLCLFLDWLVFIDYLTLFLLLLGLLVRPFARISGLWRSLMQYRSHLAPLRQVEQVVQVFFLKEAPAGGVRQDEIGHELLEDLSMVNLLFNRFLGDKAVDCYITRLANPNSSLSSL